MYEALGLVFRTAKTNDCLKKIINNQNRTFMIFLLEDKSYYAKFEYIPESYLDSS